MKTDKLIVAVEAFGDYIGEVIAEIISEQLKFHSEPLPEVKENVLFNFREMCSLLGISQTTGHKWKKQGVLPFHRLGGRIYFKESEIIDSLKAIKRRKSL